MAKRGRPTKYCIEYNEQVEKLCKLGATDKELADFFNVAESTINYWKKNEPDFSESIKKGKILADANVSQSLYKRACGYDYGDKHYPPDPTSIIYWLSNRRPNWHKDGGKNYESDADQELNFEGWD